jgi:hypothetical protein
MIVGNPDSGLVALDFCYPVLAFPLEDTSTRKTITKPRSGI